MPFGDNGGHISIELIDFKILNKINTSSHSSTHSDLVRKKNRADIVLIINGIPLVVEAKTPVRSSQSWMDGALQIHDKYEAAVPELFVPSFQ